MEYYDLAEPAEYERRSARDHIKIHGGAGRVALAGSGG